VIEGCLNSVPAICLVRTGVTVECLNCMVNSIKRLVQFGTTWYEPVRSRRVGDKRENDRVRSTATSASLIDSIFYVTPSLTP